MEIRDPHSWNQLDWLPEWRSYDGCEQQVIWDSDDTAPRDLQWRRT